MERVNWYKKFLIKDLENVIDLDIKLKKYKDIILIGYGKYGSPEFRKEIRKDKRKFKKFKKLLKKLENDKKIKLSRNFIDFSGLV